jgi:AcrR family transcriptional regulator
MAAKTPPEAPFHKQLTREIVVKEAMALLDENGLDALTMRSLADRFGVVPNALYRHVKDKGDLMDGVLDLATSLVEVPDPALGWRAGLGALATNIRSTMLAHPAIANLVISRPNLGPHSIVIGEFGFAVTLAAGFTPAHAERSLNLVLTYTLGFVALEVPRIHEPEVSAEELQQIYEGIPEGMLPNTVIVRPGPGELVTQDQFTFGLEQVLESLVPFVGETA